MFSSLRSPAFAIVLLGGCVLAPLPGPGQTRRALVIGINTYQHAAPPKAAASTHTAEATRKSRGAFTDLDGCTTCPECSAAWRSEPLPSA